jgi:peptidoglycan/LPS O-acetylase OafA/YrhL
MSERFRPEIAGLRAVAVAGVVLFHLKLTGFQGGFVGVDVFFVISGYLITRNILADINSGQFSFCGFYARRTRRIYPALIFTVLATYLLGALWCSPPMFLDLAKESTHAILSISNIQYWREAEQYFAPHAENLALLHCWSLSLEEQFYLFWPALILLASKSGRVFTIVALVGAASLAHAIIASRSDPSAAFFLTPFRIFEFAIGAMVLPAEANIRLTRPMSEALSAIGMGSILASALLFHSEMPGADVASLIPCVGAALVIRSGGMTWSAMMLTNRAAVAVGAISYSLYLCHWPVIFFGRFIFGEAADSASSLLIMVATMMAVATLMHALVEWRFLHDPRSFSANFRKDLLGFSRVILAIAALTHSTFVAKGFAWRLPKDQAELLRLQSPSFGRGASDGEGPFGFQLVGDSFADQYLAGLAQLAGQLGMKPDLLVFPGCPLLYGATKSGRPDPDCQSWHEQALAGLQKSNLPVILAQRWENYIGSRLYWIESSESGVSALDLLQQRLEITLEPLIHSGRRILIIGDQVKTDCPIDPPRLLSGPLPHAPAKPCPPTSRDAVERATAPINRMLEKVRARWPRQVALLRPVDYFCDVDCPVVKDGVSLYFDDCHFSLAGAKYMVERSEGVFRRFLANETRIGSALAFPLEGSKLSASP